MGSLWASRAEADFLSESRAISRASREMEKPVIEISQPRRFGVLSILAKYAFSFLLLIPFVAALMLISLQNLGQASLLILFLTLVGTICISPALGNLYVFWAVRGLKSGAGMDDRLSIVQISFWPRIRKGFRALLEDADDVGYLSIDDTKIDFVGDSVRLSLPLQRVSALQGENVGLRGLYVTSGRITLQVSGLNGCEEIEIAERSSRLIFSSRKRTRELFADIQSKLGPQ